MVLISDELLTCRTVIQQSEGLATKDETNILPVRVTLCNISIVYGILKYGYLWKPETL